jgi:cysteine-rich repeat protein
MRATAMTGMLAGTLMASAACTNDYDALAPGAAGGGGTTSGSSSVGAANGGADASSASTGGPASSSSVSAGGTGAGGAPAGGGGPEGGNGGMGGGAADPCGNGVLDAGEQCDGGTPASGDGCSSSCTLEGDPLAGCEAQVEITAFPLFIRGDTSNGVDFTAAPGCWAYAARDAVYRLVAPSDGHLVATVETIGEWGRLWALRDGCGPSAGFCTVNDTLERDMVADEIAHVMVTGDWAGASGEYVVALTFR